MAVEIMPMATPAMTFVAEPVSDCFAMNLTGL